MKKRLRKKLRCAEFATKGPVLITNWADYKAMLGSGVALTDSVQAVGQGSGKTTEHVEYMEQLRKALEQGTVLNIKNITTHLVSDEPA